MDSNPLSVASIAQSVHASMDDALKTIPADQSGAVFIGAKVNNGETQFDVVAAQKFGEHWRFFVGGKWQEHHGYGAEVGIMGSWGGSHPRPSPLAEPDSSMSAGS